MLHAIRGAGCLSFRRMLQPSLGAWQHPLEPALIVTAIVHVSDGNAWRQQLCFSYGIQSKSTQVLRTEEN
eukprot:753843-Amphidinium_carterae.1